MLPALFGCHRLTCEGSATARGSGSGSNFQKTSGLLSSKCTRRNSSSFRGITFDSTEGIYDPLRETERNSNIEAQTFHSESRTGDEHSVGKRQAIMRGQAEFRR